MHELTIAEALLGAVLRAAEAHAAKRVSRATVRVGALNGLSPAALHFGFEALAGGTPAAGCTLELVRVPAMARCRACAWQGELHEFDVICPQCDRAALELSGGQELTLAGISVDT